MSPREFEIAQQYLTQTKDEVLRAIAALQTAAKTWSEYDLSLEEEAQLHQQLQLNLQEIHHAIAQQLSPSRGLVTKGTENLENNICAEIPPFDPDEDF